MASENDNVKPEGTEGSSEHKHHSWLENIIDEERKKVNTEFPLSGAETEEDFESVDNEDEKAPGDETPKEHHSWMHNIVERIQKLDSEFPLSGGETEEDFEGADDKEEDEK